MFLKLHKKKKKNYTNNDLFINNDNVHLTYANVVKLNGDVYGVYGDDNSLIKSYSEIVDAIKNGDDVIINLNYTNYIIASIIVTESLETKLKNAISDENYKLAEIIKNKIKQMKNLDLTKKEVVMKCNNIEDLHRTIMSVSSFLFQKVRGDETYNKFVLGNSNLMEKIENKIPNGFLFRTNEEIPSDKIIVLLGKESDSLFGVVDFQN